MLIAIEQMKAGDVKEVIIAEVDDSLFGKRWIDIEGAAMKKVKEAQDGKDVIVGTWYRPAKTYLYSIVLEWEEGDAAFSRTWIGQGTLAFRDFYETVLQDSHFMIDANGVFNIHLEGEENQLDAIEKCMEDSGWFCVEDMNNEMILAIRDIKPGEEDK